ncbi:MAG: hypothetical protein KJ060_01880 [Candidatus Hydrogenedentes bacterium]|nr:hypothetical protein [Candidatus Hydrogenedentota bacterium]
MTSRERLMAMLERRPVDRPGVNFYEIGGFNIDPTDPDPFNIYNHPSWQPLLQLAEEQTDLIRMRPVRWVRPDGHPWHEFFTREVTFEGDARFTRTTLRIAGRTMTQTDRRDKGLDTTWMVEHLLKDLDDLKAYLQLPDEVFDAEPDLSPFASADEEVGERGIIMLDTEDPLCVAAQLFSMDTFTLIAYTEGALFHELLEKIARPLHARTETVAREVPGHLWRIYGPEYATEPYLPTPLFEEYVVRYTKPMLDAIKRYGGYPRVHCHGRIKHVLPHFVAMGADATDPIEPPPQGDVHLANVRREFGKDLVLFGNIEVSDIENLEPRDFEKVVTQALRDGTHGEGRGFVLMPTSCPYGREISARTMANYETMARLTREWGG